MDSQKAALDKIIQFAKQLMVKRRSGAPSEPGGEEMPPEELSEGLSEVEPEEAPEACEKCGADMIGGVCECTSGDVVKVLNAGRIGGSPSKPSSSKMPVAKKKFSFEG